MQSDFDPKLLNSGTFVSHDPRYFAMMNTTVAMTNSKYEGGNAADAIRYYQDLLAMELPNAPSSFKLTSPGMLANEHLEQLKKTLSQMLEIAETQFELRKKNSNQTTALVDKITELLDQGCEYIPGGYMGNPGHYVTYKFRKNSDGQYAISVLNQGAGMDAYHLTLGTNGTKVTSCYQSDEFLVDIKKKSGQELLQRLMQLYVDDMPLRDGASIRPYEALDIYSLLNMYGTRIPMTDHLKDKQVTGQRAGSCTVSNLNAAMRDVLIDNNLDFKARKRYHFIVKFRSMIDAYDAYLNNNCPRDLLAWSLNEFSTRVNKLYHDLSPEEMNYCTQVVSIMQARLTKDQKKLIEKESFAELPTLSTRAIRKIEPRFEDEGSVKSQGTQAPVVAQTSANPAVQTKGSIQAHHIKDALLAINKDESTENHSFEQAYKLLMSLPRCSGRDKDPFWDSVPKQDIPHIITRLAELVLMFPKQIESPIEKSHATTIKLLAYDISSQLTRDLPETYALGLDDNFSEQAAYLDPIDYFTMKQVAENFSRRCQNKTRIFTNFPGNNDKTDSTIDYIINVVLSAPARDAITQAIKKQQHTSANEITDSARFIHLMEDLNMTYKNASSQDVPVLPQNVRQLMEISMCAHGGVARSLHYANVDFYRCFSKSHYINELMRKSAQWGTNTKAVAHIPSLFNDDIIGEQFNSFSENTNYHPIEPLRALRSTPQPKQDGGFYRYSFQNEPYQLQLSGSMSPDSAAWKPSEEQRKFYEEMHDELRHLETAPHLQIIRTLTWIGENTDKLHNADVRQRLTELVFQYGKLEAALVGQFDLVMQACQSMYTNLVKFCDDGRNKSARTTLWAGQMALHLRQYIEVTAQAHHLSIKKDLLFPTFIPSLIKQIKAEVDNTLRAGLANIVLNNYRNITLTLNQLSNAFTCRIIANLGDGGLQSNDIWQQLFMQFTQLSQKDQTRVYEQLKSNLNEFGVLPEKTTFKLIGNRLLIEGSPLSVDLQSGKIESLDSPSITFRTQQTIADNQVLFADLRLSKDNVALFRSGQSKTLSSTDNRWSFDYSELQGRDEIMQLKIHTTHQLIDLNGRARKFKLVDKIDLKKGTNADAKDRLDVLENIDHQYQYWQSTDNPGVYFIECRDNPDVAYLYQPGGINIVTQKKLANSQIIEYQRNDQQQWRSTETILLNLAEPEAPFEVSLAARLGQQFGMRGLRCIAEQRGDQLQVIKLEHLLLNLTFKVENGKELSCVEYPGFHLAPQSKIPGFESLADFIILENNKGEKKIILPGYSLEEGEKNNALNTENVVDKNHLINNHHPYFEYTVHGNRLIPVDNKTAAESNLYLAILYRSKGDYQSAMHYLDAAKSNYELSPEAIKVTQEVLNRKMISPLDAAFNLKLHCYLQEQFDKRINRAEQKPGFPLRWIDHIYLNLTQHENTYSHYKTGISIIPNFLRLTASEKKQLQTMLFIAPASDRAQQNKLAQLPRFYVLQNSIEVFSRLAPNYKIASTKVETMSRSGIDSVICAETFTPFYSVRYALFGNETPGLDYLRDQFAPLMKMLLTEKPTQIAQARRTLQSVMINDKSPDKTMFDLITVLMMVADNPQHFKILVVKRNLEELLTEIVEIFSKHPCHIKPESLDRLTYRINGNPLQHHSPLPSDFQKQTTRFSFQQMNIRYAQECQHPLGPISTAHFDMIQHPIAKGEFPLKVADLPDATPIERKLIADYERGHAKNLNKNKPLYMPNKKSDLPGLKSQLQKSRDEDQSKVNELIVALKRANKTPLDDPGSTNQEKAKALNLLHARASGQNQELKISDLFAAFLQKKPELLTEQNPFLTQQDIDTLFANLAEYALLHARINQTNSALNIIGNKSAYQDLSFYEFQQLANIVDKKRAYDIKVYPELLVYEYATHRLLRSEQVETLIALMKAIEEPNAVNKMQHVLLQFAAGGGKTSVLIPILAQRFAAKGLMPVILNTNELYQIGLEEIPKNLKASLNQNLEVIEYDLAYKWSTPDLISLLADLERWKSEGKCLLIKSVTWHSLNITKKTAYAHHDVSMIQAAEAVLDFFKQKTVKLEDESHIISDPRQQSIKTDGTKKKIPSNQVELLLTIYDHLLGKGKIAELAGLQSQRKTPLSAADLAKLQSALANELVTYLAFKNCDAKQLLQYSLSSEKSRPAWLEKIHQNDASTADLIVLSRAFIQSHLPHILTMQKEKDYGHSTHTGDLTAAPKHEGKNVSSHFGDHSLVAALTIQLYHQDGLRAEQVGELIEQLIKEHHQERTWNHQYEQPTTAESRLLALIPELNSINELTADIIKEVSQHETLRFNTDFIKQFLQNNALPQIVVPSLRFSSTAAELQAGFSRSILLSATPGLPETYPAFLNKEHCYLEESFEAQVISTLLSTVNKGHFYLAENATTHLNSMTPADFFKQLPQQALKDLTTLIDRGALLTDFDASKVVAAYFEQSGTASAAAHFSKDNLHLKSKSPIVAAKELKGAGLVDELRRQGIEPEKFILFLFLDLSKTTGTDIQRPFTDKAGLTVGKGQTITETIQAAMRERQLLEKNAQSVTWIMFKSLYQSLAGTDEFDPKKLFYWLIKNEANQIETKLVMRAYQGIAQALTGLAWEQVRKNPILYTKYADLLSEQQSISPWDLYELSANLDDTKQVLTAYRDRLLARFGFDKDNIAIPQDIHDRIKLIIQQTEQLIAKLLNPPKTPLQAEVEQEMEFEAQQEEEQEQEQEMQQQTKYNSAENFMFAIETYRKDSDNLDAIFSSQRSAFGYSEFNLKMNVSLPKLIINRVHFSAFEVYDKKRPASDSQLKPIKMLLVKIMPNGQTEYLACTAAGAEFYLYQMKSRFLSANDPAYSIISTDGNLLATSNNLTAQFAKEVVEKTSCQKMLAYINFLNGKINNPALLSQVIKEHKWTKEQFQKICDELANIHVGNSPMNLQNSTLDSLCGWNNRPLTLVSAKDPVKKQPLPTQTLTPDDSLNQYTPRPIPVTPPTQPLDGIYYKKEAIPNHHTNKNPDAQPEFKMNFTEWKSMFNTQRDKALMRVQQDADYIHNSAIPPAEKTQVLRSHVDEFREIDHFLQSLLTDLAGFAPDAKDPNVKAYLDVRDDAVKAINNFFTLVAKGEKVPNAGMTLNENLRDLAEHSASVQKTAPTLWRLKHATGDKFNKLIVGQLKEFDRVLKAFAVTGQQPKKGS